MRWLTCCLLLLQLGTGQKTSNRAEPKFFRYQRELQSAVGKAGQTCAVLDAAVFAHAADRAPNDLRLFAASEEANPSSQAEREVPFALIESAPEPGEVEPAVVTNEQVRGGLVTLELAMPARPYSVISLQIASKDFFAKAEVTALRADGGESRPLGTVTLFDLSAHGLPRSTDLRLGEATEPRLRVVLEFFDEHGKQLSRLPPQVVTGATVPPSREAQVLYTPVVETMNVESEGEGSYATLQVPEHVPVDRLSVEPAPSFHGDFLREVSVEAHPAETGPVRGTAPGMPETPGMAETPGVPETVRGTLARLTRLNPGPGLPALHFERLQVPFALGSNLRSAAEVRVSLQNSLDGRPLAPTPLRSVRLEMRRRTLCFEAVAGKRYTLRYGDAALGTPVYEYARSFRPATTPVVAELGPERANPGFFPRAQHLSYAARHPELFWTALIAVIALTGVLVTHHMERGKRDR